MYLHLCQPSNALSPFRVCNVRELPVNSTAASYLAVPSNLKSCESQQIHDFDTEICKLVALDVGIETALQMRIDEMYESPDVVVGVPPSQVGRKCPDPRQK